MAPPALVVLGRDASRFGMDFTRLSKVHTLALDGSYRDWQARGWFPTFYCCLDPASIHTHAQAIMRLVEAQRIHRFFLGATILDLFPEVATRSGVEFLEEYAAGGSTAASRQHRLAHRDSVFFQTVRPDQAGTAGYVVRWALALGYRRVGLLGVDCDERSVEYPAMRDLELPSVGPDQAAAKPQHDSTRRSDDGRIAQERFDGSNPQSPGSNVDIQSFETLREDLLRQQEEIALFNLSTTSELHRQGVLAYTTLEDFIDERRLAAVVCPLIPRELTRALECLELWDQAAFAPYQTLPADPAVDLIYSFNIEEDRYLVDQLTAAFNATSIVRRSFRSLRFLFCGLRGERDVYNRSLRGAPGVLGYKGGPNNLFFETMRRLDVTAPYVFQMETDCCPTRSGWLAELERVCRRHHGAWIIGSYYRGCGLLGRPHMRHINGNAIYGIGISEFRAFLWDIFKPWLERYVAQIDSLLAYDCGWDLFVQQAKPDDGRDPFWPHVRLLLGKFQYTEAIVNVNGSGEQSGQYQWSLGDIRRRFPACAVAHGPIDRSPVPVLIAPEKDRPGPIPLPHPTEDSEIYLKQFCGVGRARLISQHLACLDGEKTRDYCCLIFGHRAGALIPGDIITATLTLSADQNCDAWLMVARHGNGLWESSGQRASIGPQSKTVTVSHTLQHPHESFRVQVSPAIRWSKSAMLHFEDIRIDLTRNGSTLGSYALSRTVQQSPHPAL